MSGRGCPSAPVFAPSIRPGPPSIAERLRVGVHTTTVIASGGCRPCLKMELTMLGFLVWLVLLFLCWPIALLALVMYPLVWLVLLPFRLLGIGVEAVFELLRAIVMLPARVLGGGVGR